MPLRRNVEAEGEAMENFKLGNLELRYQTDGNGLTMTWLGKSTLPDPMEALMPYFTRSVEKWIGKKLTIDFRGLEYMNSCTVSLIVQLLKKLDEAKMATTIVYDKGLKWQALSFQALESIDSLFKNVHIEGK
jgi:hypothetical protein